MARDIDDPANIARFLAMINGQPELPASETSFSSAGENSIVSAGVEVDDTPAVLTNVSPVASISEAMSLASINTPLVTPLAVASNTSGQSWNNAIGQPRLDQHTVATEAPRIVTPHFPQITQAHGNGPRTWTSTQKALLARRAEMEKNGKDWMDNVVAEFRRSNQGEMIQGRGAHTVGIALANPTNDRVLSAPETEAFPDFDESVQPNALGGVQLGDGAFSTHVDQEYSSLDGNASNGRASSFEPADFRQEELSTEAKTLVEPAKTMPSPTIVVTASTDTDGSDLEGKGEEDRQHATHFKTWGTPAARSKPKSQIRTVILVGLPGTTDFTLVQSLVHGGTIETMRLMPVDAESRTTTAYVTFTTAEAFNQYYERYPNGFDLRHKGKKHNILVDKQERVDVMSSAMAAYLECGATRVLKVRGAEDDWGVVALHKIATGKAHPRQIETITDTYSNSVRTIFFRFTNIQDAVNFKACLGRDIDWESCALEFVEDPCEKATGFHFRPV